ncbi:MAG: esterase/lipase family protein [Nevskiales bacterium]
MNEAVVLLHGLARTRRSMRPVQRALERAGYQVLNIGYPSRREPVERLANMAFSEIGRRLQEINPARVHFVTHSMGGILLRQILSQHRVERLGRVVMLAPPNQGSELVDRLGRLRLFRLLNGPAGLQLGAGTDSLPRRLPPADFDLGVITGTRGLFNPVLWAMLPKPNDGKVTVASAQLEGMRDFRVLPVTHTFLMGNRRVIDLTLHFLRHGRFDA